MFDIGWTEMLVIAIVMIVVVGPKDLPRMLRTFGKTTAKLRAMAGDFQKQFNEALHEAELEDLKKSVDDLRSLDPSSEVRKQLNPFEKAAQDIRAGLDTLKPAPPPVIEPASAGAQPAEPLKAGAADMPGLAAADQVPPAPFTAPAALRPAPPVASPQPTVPLPAKPAARTPRAAKGGGRPKAPTAPAKEAKPRKVSSTVAKATAAAVPSKAAQETGRVPAEVDEKPTRRRATRKTDPAA
jgi:sec-independent protein translocase protein TatB